MIYIYVALIRVLYIYVYVDVVCKCGQSVGSMAGELKHLAHVFLCRVVRDPDTLLRLSGGEETLRTLHGLHIEVGDVRLAVRKLHADLVLS